MGAQKATQQNDINGARELFRKAVELEPNCKKALFYLTGSYISKEMLLSNDEIKKREFYLEGLNYGHRLLALDETNMDANYLISYFYSELKKYNESIYYTNNMLKIGRFETSTFVKNEKQKNELIYFDLANKYGLTGDVQNALHYLKIVKSNCSTVGCEQETEYHTNKMISLIERHKYLENKQKTIKEEIVAIKSQQAKPDIGNQNTKNENSTKQSNKQKIQLEKKTIALASISNEIAIVDKELDAILQNASIKKFLLN